MEATHPRECYEDMEITIPNQVHIWTVLWFLFNDESTTRKINLQRRDQILKAKPGTGGLPMYEHVVVGKGHQ